MGAKSGKMYIHQTHPASWLFFVSLMFLRSSFVFGMPRTIVTIRSRRIVVGEHPHNEGLGSPWRAGVREGRGVVAGDAVRRPLRRDTI